MTLGYLYLFFGNVATHLYQFHAVQERTRNGVDVIGRGDEHDTAQVIVYIQEIVMECRILFRVKHFEQCRRGIAVVCGLAYLVYLVQHKDGVAASCLDQVLHNTAGHGSDVSTSVASNLAFVMHSAQAHAYILALQRLGNAFAQTGLTHSRRTVQTDDGALLVATELKDSQMFQNAFLHLLHSIMVLVEDFLCRLQLQMVNGAIVPRQLQHGLQIVQLHVVVGALYVDTLQAHQFLMEDFLHLVAPHLALGLFSHLVDVILLAARLVRTTKFGLQIFDLLVQEILLLLLVQFGTGLVLNGLLDLLQLNQRIDDLKQCHSSVLFARSLQQLLLGRQVQWQVHGDEVHAGRDKGKVADKVVELFRSDVADLQEMKRSVLYHLQQRQILAVFGVCRLIVIILDIRHQDITLPIGIRNPGSVKALHQHVQIAVGQFHTMYNLCDNAHMFQVFKCRSLNIGSLLGHHHDTLVFLLRFFYQLAGKSPSHQNSGNVAREESAVSQRQHSHCSAHMGMYNVLIVLIRSHRERKRHGFFGICHIENLFHKTGAKLRKNSHIALILYIKCVTLPLCSQKADKDN